MKLTSTLLASVLVTPLFGTIIVVEFKDNQIIVAADSRTTKSDGSTPDDHACKITQLGQNSFCFVTGLARYYDSTGKIVWDAVSLSKTAFLASGRTQDQFTLVRTAANWAELIEEAYINSSITITPSSKPDGVSQAFFGNQRDHVLQMYRVLLQSPPPQLKKPTIIIQPFNSDEVPLSFMGDHDAIALVGEFLADTTARSKLKNAALQKQYPQTTPDYEARRIEYAIKAAIEWMPDKGIGGDVDLMVLKPTGSIRWIELKKECSTAKNK